MESVENSRNTSLGRWMNAIELGSRSVYVVCYSCLLRGAGGEVSMSSPFGQWAQAISEIADGNPDRKAALPDLFKGLGRQLSLSSAFGQWAQRMTAIYAA